MIKLFSKTQMKMLDRLAMDTIGIPSAALMEVAGRAVADAVAHCPVHLPEKSVLVVAGLGNNGGDAVVAARHLAGRGWSVQIVLVGHPGHKTPELEQQLEMARRLGLSIRVLEDDQMALVENLARASRVVVDGLFGIGLSRPIEGLSAQVIRALAASGAPVVAVDIPSGIDADTGQILGVALPATCTVTFQTAKLGHYVYPGREYSGTLQVVDIGIPSQLWPQVQTQPQASVLDAQVMAQALPARSANTNKGTFGHLLLVAGQRDHPGSALLAGRAALRIGAGLVTVASDAETIRRIAPAMDELMGLSVGQEALEPTAILAALSHCSALAIGPSLTPSRELGVLLRAILSDISIPVVIDAGALGALAILGDLSWLAARSGGSAPKIFTPHPKEMARLASMDVSSVQADRVGVARLIARTAGAHVVLKGASTLVVDPEGGVCVCAAGNAAMATAGTGDVLTGILGGLLAQGVEPGLAAKAGVLLHATAGDQAAAAQAERLIASDLLSFMNPARASLRRAP